MRENIHLISERNEKENKIMELTQNQRKVAEQTRDEYVNLFLDNIKEERRIDKPAFEKGIEWLYYSASLHGKPEIIYCDSWIECMLSIAMFKDNGNSVNRKIIDTINFAVIDNLQNSIHSLGGSSFAFGRIHNAVSTLILNSIWESILDSVKNSFLRFISVAFKNPIVYSVQHMFTDSDKILKYDYPFNSDLTLIQKSVEYAAIKKSLWSLIQKNVTGDIRNFVGMEFINIFNGYALVCGLTQFDMIAYLDFFCKTGMVEPGVFEKYKSFIKSFAFAVYLYENRVFAVQPPRMSLNAQRRLHSTEGPAVRFGDVEGYYFINGRSVPAVIFEKKDQITADLFLNEDNAETKAAIYEVLGHERMMEMLGAETVHTSEIQHANGETETVELIKTRQNFAEIGNQPFAWVKVTCPSSGTNYLLGVEPKYENAAEAVASLSMFASGEYSFNFRT
jgi:hypothetical protein